MSSRFQRVFAISLSVLVAGSISPSLAFPDTLDRLITTIPISSSMQFPFGIVIDPNGEIVISHDGRAISRVDKDGKLHRVAGGTTQGFSGDTGLASQATLFGPGRPSFDNQGNLFIPDMANHRIRKIDYGSGRISTVVGRGPTGRGKGTFGGDGGPGIHAFLNRPISVAFDSTGALYIADAGNFRIRKVTPGDDGVITGDSNELITTVAGIGKRGFTHDKKLAITARIAAVDIAIDSSDHVFMADAMNNRIRRVDSETGIITTVVGTGPVGEIAGYFGHGTAAKHARLSSPEGIAFDQEGNLYIADTLNHRVRVVTPGEDRLITGQSDEIITTIVGSGTIGSSGGGFHGDGGPASQAKINRPQDIAIDADGDITVVDGLNHKLRRVKHATTIMPIHLLKISRPDTSRPVPHSL